MAFQDLHGCMLDEELRNGVVAKTYPITGLPMPSSGRFACVFKVQCGSKVYGVKCFFNTSIMNLQERYKSISRYLSKLSLPFFVKFEFLDKGIIVSNRMYPIIKMEWVEGDRLDIAIEKHLNDKTFLEKLAEEFIDSVIEMQKNKIAHGDLQHGNILVRTVNNSIKLYFVDYDGIFIPDFKGERAPELGHPNYQHPKRNERHYNEKLDNFSSLVIYLSILAIANNPKLWDNFYNGENLIFTKKDFEDPKNSRVIQELLKSSSKKVRNLTMLLIEMLKDDPLSDKINLKHVKYIT